MRATLILANGSVFEGRSIGSTADRVCEMVFNTSMTGYQEILTDPSYAGQGIVMCYPLIGNYGVIPSDFEGKIIGPCGYIVKEWCQSPSNFRSEGDLDTFFKKRGVIGLCGIDTRALTKVIRESGVMNGMITTELTHVDMDKIHSYRVTNAVESTSVTEMTRRENPEKTCTVALMDYGYKENIRRELEKRGAEVIVCPYNTTADELKALNIDGVMLSNGPGDPADNIEVIENLKKIMNMGKPLFGICLGHQLLALAIDAKTTKLKYGHRGVNHPVKDIDADRTYITSQNHGYAVVGESVDPQIARVRYVNLNDGTVEGLEHIGRPVFTVQYHPEVCPGPMDTSYLFDKFIENIEKSKGGAQ